LLVGLLAMSFGTVFADPIGGSNFDTGDGNLVDPPFVDWETVNETRQNDLPSGQADDSFTQGSKEDTLVPSIEFGSIPPNKSDLKTFGVYQEKVGGKNFLHLFWTRVQDPSGTTNMDFEFNQSSVASGNGVTPVRTVGDLLITYDLSRGGTVPTISVRFWQGSAWGPATDLSAVASATGSINSALIPASESDGLGQLDPRTFGEASVDLDAVFGSGSCQSFGSAFLKSRSSDSFTAAMKDFIAPKPVNVSNCGGITIRKETDPDGAPGTFSFTGDLGAFSLQDNGSKVFTNVQAGTYVVAESDPAAQGFDLQSIVCSGGSTTTSVPNRNVSITVAADDNVVCTFTNKQRGKIIVQKVTNPSGATDDFSFTTSYGSGSFTLKGGQSNDSGFLAAGTYSVVETVPAGWDLTSATCSDGSSPSNIGLSSGETVTCTFTNTQRGKIIIQKVTNPAGSTQSFDFTASYVPGGFSLQGGGSNDSGLIQPGTYSVSETVPDGWQQTSATCSDGSNPGSIGLGAGETVTCTFTNTQLFAVVVLVCEQGPGTLYPSTVNDKTSLSQAQLTAAGFTAAQIKTLCDLTTGARFPDKTPGGPYNYAVTIPQ
jgi:hypothetical protein